MTFNELINTKELVKEILTKKPETRLSDYILYKEVLNRIETEMNVELLYMPLIVFLDKHNEYGMPPFESVSRARRKAQQENPDLKDVTVAEFRNEEQEAYEKFAREG